MQYAWGWACGVPPAFLPNIAVQPHTTPYSFGQVLGMCASAPFWGQACKVCLLGEGSVEVSEVFGVRGNAVV